MKQTDPTYQQLLTEAREAYGENCEITNEELGIQRFDLDLGNMYPLLSLLNHPSCKITSLNLRNNYIGTEGVIALATALQSKSCKITSLYLENNNIGPEDAKSLASALQSKHCKITKLNLVGNNIGPEGTNALASALQS